MTATKPTIRVDLERRMFSIDTREIRLMASVEKATICTTIREERILDLRYTNVGERDSDFEKIRSLLKDSPIVKQSYSQNIYLQGEFEVEVKA